MQKKKKKKTHAPTKLALDWAVSLHLSPQPNESDEKCPEEVFSHSVTKQQHEFDAPFEVRSDLEQKYLLSLNRACFSSKVVAGPGIFETAFCAASKNKSQENPSSAYVD